MQPKGTFLCSSPETISDCIHSVIKWRVIQDGKDYQIVNIAFHQCLGLSIVSSGLPEGEIIFTGGFPKPWRISEDNDGTYMYEFGYTFFIFLTQVGDDRISSNGLMLTAKGASVGALYGGKSRWKRLQGILISDL